MQDLKDHANIYLSVLPSVEFICIAMVSCIEVIEKAGVLGE